MKEFTNELTKETEQEADGFGNKRLQYLFSIDDVQYYLLKVWSKEEAEKAALQIRTGNIFINAAEGNPYAPFGGFKQSGFGRENGIYGIKDYLQTKAVFK